MGWKRVTDQISTGQRSCDQGLAPLTNLDAVFGRGRKVDGIRKGSLYRNFIEIHPTPYSNITVSQAQRRISYIHDNIMNVVQDMGGRFIMRQVGDRNETKERNSCGLIELDADSNDDQALILKKIRRALFNENKRRSDLPEGKRAMVEQEMEERRQELEAQWREKRGLPANASSPSSPPRKTMMKASRDASSNADTKTTASASTINSTSTGGQDGDDDDDDNVGDNLEAKNAGGFLNEIDFIIKHEEQGTTDPLVSWDFQFDENDTSFDTLLEGESI